LTFWVETAQVISGFATLGALIFVGAQSMQIRKQTRIMQGRGWIGAVEESWITESEHDIIVSLTNYGNVISKVLAIKFLVKETEEFFSSADMEKKGTQVYPEELPIFPDKQRKFLIPGEKIFGKTSRVCIKIDYEDAYGTKGEYGLIIKVNEGEPSNRSFNKTAEWFS
jgi:hypothetical protein